MQNIYSYSADTYSGLLSVQQKYLIEFNPTAFPWQSACEASLEMRLKQSQVCT